MGYDKERWIELCEKAAVEQNPRKLLAFMTEINSLEAKDQSRRALTLALKPPYHQKPAEDDFNCSDRSRPFEVPFLTS